MNKTQGYVVAAAIVVTIVYLIYGQTTTMSHTHSSNRNTESLPEEVLLEKVRKKSTTSVNVEANKNSSLNKQKKFEERIRLAHAVGILYDQIQDEKSAKLFLDKMRDCSRDSADTPVAVKSSCVHYLDRLEKRFPQLKTDIGHVREQASQEARGFKNISH